MVGFRIRTEAPKVGSGSGVKSLWTAEQLETLSMTRVKATMIKPKTTGQADTQRAIF
jgi:hypothetical protein